MSVVYIPEEEAVKDFRSVLAKAAAGDEIVIDHAGSRIRVIGSARPKVRTVGEMLAILAERPDPGVMDPELAEDVKNFRRRHPESLGSSAWD